MSGIRFTKMQGLGNDFVVVDALSREVGIGPEQARRLADRRFGVGCDQVLLAERPTREGADVRLRIYNADGGEVEHCGNGLRCLARFLHDKGLVAGDELQVELVNGLARACLGDDGLVTVDMGEPVLEPQRIPFRAPREAVTYPLRVDGEAWSIGAVSMGNPHAVLLVDDVDTAPVASLGPLVERHGDFPDRVNAGFMQVVGRSRIRLRVYERGAGETLACGTGACAAVVSGRLRGLLDERVAVDLPGGRLMIHWSGRGHPVWMAGPAVTVFEGEIPL